MKEKDTALVRYGVLVRGRVHGVGFRFEAARRAQHLHLSGFVANCPAGVYIEAEGPAATVKEFLRSLEARPPVFARVNSLQRTQLPAHGKNGDFEIRHDLSAPTP